MAKRSTQDDRLRHLLTQECARIIADEHIKDFAKAKRKAVERLGLGSRVLLPSNVEIEQALIAYQRLFKADEQPLLLRELRTAAVSAMRLLKAFRPLLVGPVLTGTAGPHSEIKLHVFANTPEDIIIFLLDRNIPFEDTQRRLRLQQGGYGDFTAIQFEFNGATVELTVFWQRNEHDIPCSPIDGRPMRRASLAEVEDLLKNNT